MAIYQSNSLTFIDQTDSRKLEVYIQSNFPTVQIFNKNTGGYTPDWKAGLNLSADVYLESREMTDLAGVTFKWYRDEVIEGEEISSTNSFTTTDNELSTNPITTYICVVSYQNITAIGRVTFSRTDTGVDGKDGADGTSVNIRGTATSVTPVANTDYYTITYDETSLSTAELGDAYIYNGDLYVCTDSRDGVDYFINIGRIQGPAGADAKNIVLSGSAQVFKISKTNVVAPTTISVAAHTFNTSATTWTYSTNGGQTFLSTVPTGVVRNGNIVTVTGSTLTSNSLVIKASDGTVEDVFTIYKAFDGTDGADGKQGDPAPLVFLTNENISFAANANGQIATTAFTTNVVAYSGTTKVTPVIGAITGLPTGMTVSAPVTTANEQILTFSIANNSTLGAATSNSGTITIPVTSPISTNLKLSWSKINTGATGAGIKSTTVTYGVSDSSSAQPTAWQSTIPTVADGKYLWTRTVTDYTDDAIADTVTYIYAKQGTKGDNGTSGSSVTVSSIQYQSGTSATTAPTGTWSNAVVAAADGQYLWTRTTFSDASVAYGVAKQGSSGRGISKITEHYLATSVSSGITSATSGWTETIQTITSANKYLWNYETIAYTDGTTSTTTPVIIGVFGNTGGTGKGISSVTEYYLATASSSGVTTSTTGWTTTMQTLTATNKYLWNYEVITYTDNTTSTMIPVIIGTYGDKGDTGASGRGIASVTEHYLATTASSGVTISTSGWTTAIQNVTSTNKYLWNYETITYTDNTTSTTTPVIIGVYGDTGNAGKGISSVTEYYLATTLASGVTTSTSGWTTAIQTVTNTKKYLWNYEVITYTDNTTSVIAPVIIGVYGDTGTGISSVTVTYGTSTSASTQPTSWQDTIPVVAEGSYLWTRTITDYTDTSVPDTVTYTYAKQGTKGDTGTAGTSVKVSSIQYQAGTSATTAPTGTWSGSVVAVSEGQFLWTKTTFSDNTVAYGVAKQGVSGTAASLVDITPSALYFKSTTGKNGTFTPEYIYLYPRFQTVTYSNWQYSVDGGATWVAASGANGMTIGTYNSVANSLRISRSSTLYTDSITSISFRCNSSNGSVYDTVSIAKIYDVVDIQIGGRNLILNSDLPITSNEYQVHTYNISEDWEIGTTYTITLKGTIGPTQWFGIWANGSSSRVAVLQYNEATGLYTATFTPTSITTQTEKLLLVYNTPQVSGETASIEWIKLEKGNMMAIDWSPAPEDLIEEASNVSVMLSNEAHLFEANASGVPAATNITLNVVGYKGSILSPTTVGAITGLPSAGMTAVVSNNGTTTTTIKIGVTTALTSAIADYGTLTIPITVNGKTVNKIFSWSKAKAGVTGATGADAYTVLLTNESHVFAGSTSAAVASSATTQVLAYKGSTAQSVTIVSVNGVAAKTAATATGIAGLTFACSALSGTSPTITFTCTTSFVSPNGSIPIVMTVDGVTFTKMFTYSIAFKGTTGNAGAAGAASSSYWLVSNTGTVQKTTSGDIICTPATVTFTGKTQVGTGSPDNYAGRWIIACTTDGTTYTDLYTSTANEAGTSVAADITYKALRARMYLAGGTTTLLDEQIIPFVSDGAVGASGSDAVTFKVYSSNGYALSINTPTVTLQTFAYTGDAEITANATYQWYAYSGGAWSVISGATLGYLDVSREDVAFSKSYMCKMTFDGIEYTDVATVDDKNDASQTFTSKPSSYFAGDIWYVGADYVPAGFTIGTPLRAEHTNATYSDDDWVAAAKYDGEIEELKDELRIYKQSFDWDEDKGLSISARDEAGNKSNFSTSISNTQLSFNYGDTATAYIDGTSMHIKEAVIESPLTVTGKYSGSTMTQAPIINIGNFSFVVESNGSLSIVTNT